MTNSITAYIGLGSNIDNPVRHIKTALQELAFVPQTEVICSSSLYRNPPLGPPQPDFINAVAVLNTRLPASVLLLELQRIEIQHERTRLQHWGPRTLDLDLLLYGNLSIITPTLTLPHPGLSQRNFVLYPLAEIAPNLCLPTGEKLQDLLKNHSIVNFEKVA